MIVAAACTLIPTTVDARENQVHLDPLKWQLELEFEGWSDRTENFGETNTNQYTEKWEVNQSGYLVSPKMVSFSVSLTPTFLQEDRSSAGRSVGVEGSSFDYDIDLTILRGATIPLDFDLGVLRSSGTTTSNWGRRTEFTQEYRSARMRWKFPAFPMVLSFDEKLQEQMFSLGRESESRFREAFERSVRWSARSSKLQVQVEKRWFDDRIKDEDFDKLQQSVTHNLRWGRNSHLTTRQEYVNREGTNAFKRLSVSENIRVQHLEELFSTLHYRYSSTTRGVETWDHLANYSLNYRPTRNLRLVLAGEGRKNVIATGSESEYGSSLSLAWKGEVFNKARLNFNFDGSLLQTDRQYSGGTFETLDVSYTIPPTLLVLLETRAIDVGSILVTDATGSQVFLEGVDYIVRSLFGDRTELQILTSGLIAAGDPILISYSAAAQPSAKFDTGTVRGSLSLDLNWMRVYHSTQFVDLTLRSGSFGEGQNGLRDHSTGVELKWSRAWLQTSARAEINSHESGEFSTESRSITETAQIDISARTHLALSASQISYVNDGRETDLNQWDVNLDWRLSNGMSVKPYVNGWNRQDEFGQTEERRVAGAKLNWRMRKFELDLDFSHRESVIEERDRTEQRLGIRIVRRSR